MASPISCVIFGGGGHARVLIDAMLEGKRIKPLAVLDADGRLHGTKILGVPVIGDDNAKLPKNVTHFVVGLGGTSDNGPRCRLFETALKRGLKPLTIVHPAATVSRFATLGDGSVVFAQAVVNPGATLGFNVIVNTGAIVEHDCVIGDHAHIATGARLAGGVTVGEGAHVGVGASVRQGITIGAGAVIGAGAAVVADVPTGATVVGVPARPLKP